MNVELECRWAGRQASQRDELMEPTAASTHVRMLTDCEALSCDPPRGAEGHELKLTVNVVVGSLAKSLMVKAGRVRASG